MSVSEFSVARPKERLPEMDLRRMRFSAGLLIMELKKRPTKLAAICYHLNHDCNSKYHIENQAMHNETIYKQKDIFWHDLAGLIQ